ncbi:hypothetical protein T01_2783, partial [Trichinella spiralis]
LYNGFRLSSWKEMLHGCRWFGMHDSHSWRIPTNSRW